MNERIKELALQSGGNPNYKAFRGHFLPPPPDYIDPATVDLEKFAELIAQDAVNTLRKRWFDANNSIPVTSDARLRAIHNGRKIGLMESVDALVEHFGVE